MIHLHAELARAEMTARVGEAQQAGRSRRLARAQQHGRLGEAHPSRPAADRAWPLRLARGAERAARQVRLAVARAL